MNEPDYNKFAKDIMKLCKKHGVKISAYNEGAVYLGPSDRKIYKDFPYSGFIFSPTKVVIGSNDELPSIVIEVD